MRIERKTAGEVTVLALTGDLDSNSVQSVDEQLNAFIEAGARKLVFNLSGLRFTHSAGLGLMIKTHRRLGDDGGKLVFSEPSKFFTSMISAVGLDNLFEAFPTDAEATAHLVDR